VSSREPLAKPPFCKTVNAQTVFVCPFKVLFNVPSIGFQIFIVLSSEPLAKSTFCKTVNASTEEVCPFKVLFSVPSIGFQIFIVLPLEPLAKRRWIISITFIKLYLIKL
jgi:hypothetical protein